MHLNPALALLISAIVGGIASELLLPVIGATMLKAAFRAYPELRSNFLPASLFRISRRIGASYAGALIGLAFAWILVSPRFLPDTQPGAWLMFGPALVAICCGVLVGAVAAVRWAMDD